MLRKKKDKFIDKSMKGRKEINLLIVILILVIIGLILYWNVLRGPFIFDDYSTIVDNKEVRTGTVINNYNKQRYIGYLSFALNYLYSGLDTFSYHIVNVIIHIINSLLVYIMIRKVLLILNDQGRIKFDNLIPLIVSILFLVHPIQTQAVSYITQRFTSLAALFVLISILFYLHFRASKIKSCIYLIISLIFSLFAYKTKENTASLFIMIAFIEFFIVNEKSNILKRLKYVVPYVILILVIPLSFMQTNKSLRELLGEISHVSYETPLISRSEYLFTQMRVIVSYIRLLIFPVNQALDYYYPLSKSFFELNTLIPFFFIAIVVCCAILLYRKHPIISFGIVWFLIFLSVESSFIPILDVIFEHRVYLPSIGFIVVIVYSIFLIEEKIKNRWFIPIIFIIIILLLSIATWRRNILWTDPVALWKDNVDKFPQNARANGNLGLALASEKRYIEAIEALKRSLGINPKIANNWYALGVCQKELGLIEEAIGSYKRALEINQNFQKAAYDLADIYMQLKKYDQAYKLLIIAKKIDDKHPYTNSLLAQYYCEMNSIKIAKSLMDEAEKYGLDLANSYFNIGICMLNKEELLTAQKYFYKTIALNKEEIDAYFFIAITYDRLNDIDKAIYFYQQYLMRAKHNAEWVQQTIARLKELESSKNY